LSSEQRTSNLNLPNPYDGLINSVFQPIYSPRSKILIGFEALSRFISSDGKSEAPNDVFHKFKNSNQAVDLDRICRQVALEVYKDHFTHHSDHLLFLNFDSAIIDLGVQGSGFLLNQTANLGIPVDRIVLEIIESRVADVNKLLDFVQMYRELGFFIALDDVGSGYSNLERLAQIHPHIIKIDRSIIKGINTSYAKEKIFQAIIQLSHSLGALALAEGIETLEEALTCLELGADLIQGFYFGSPKPFPYSGELSHSTLQNMLSIYSDRYMKKTSSQKAFLLTLESETRSLAQKLKQMSQTEWNQGLLTFLSNQQEIDCAYVLDINGIQVTQTIFYQNKPKTTNPLFSPSQIGADHSAKPYFLQTRRTPSFILSDSYISLATGKVCQTLVLPFRDSSRKSYRLCLDISLS
jgi:EAL domain-containing protein (putative c-di-GMP-specific phosphodiesterase class I)